MLTSLIGAAEAGHVHSDGSEGTKAQPESAGLCSWEASPIQKLRDFLASCASSKPVVFCLFSSLWSFSIRLASSIHLLQMWMMAQACLVT